MQRACVDWFIQSAQQPWEAGNINTHFVDEETEIQKIAQDYTGSVWPNQDSNPGTLIPKAVLLALLCAAGI